MGKAGIQQDVQHIQYVVIMPVLAAAIALKQLRQVKGSRKRLGQ